MMDMQQLRAANNQLVINTLLILLLLFIYKYNDIYYNKQTQSLSPHIGELWIEELLHHNY